MKELDAKELERILADEEEIQPMTGFSTRVMRAVKEESRAQPPLAFPWSRFLPGFLLNVGLLLGATVWMIFENGSAAGAQPVTAEWLADPHLQGLFWAASSVLGAGALAWAASRWAAPRRTTSF